MRKILNVTMMLLFICLISSCENMAHKNECLNLENFEEFYYNGNLYTLDGYYDVYSNYDFYGPMHKIGYTIGVYGHVFETCVLDSDVEENILFQKEGSYFWFKEGFEFPDLTNAKINKLLIQKFDNEHEFIAEKEFILENILLYDLLVEYSIDESKDTYLLDYHNFSTYEISYIYENGIITGYDRITIYNNNLFILSSHNDERVIYVFNEDYSLRLYDFILKNF